MTLEELKAEANKLGYTVVKKTCQTCSCYMPYPNENHKHKNGRWKCVDKYRPIKRKKNSNYSPITKCIRKKENEDENSNMDNSDM